MIVRRAHNDPQRNSIPRHDRVDLRPRDLLEPVVADALAPFFAATVLESNAASVGPNSPDRYAAFRLSRHRRSHTPACPHCFSRRHAVL